MAKTTKHSAILIAAYFMTSLLNYAFGVGLSWFFDPQLFGVLGVAQSLLLLVGLAVGSGFTWTAAHDLASNGATSETKRRFRSALLANGLLGLLTAAILWLLYTTGLLPLGRTYATIIPLIGLTTLLLAIRSVISGAARGLFQFSQVGINLVLEVVVKALVGVTLVVAGYGVVGVMIGFACGAAVSILHILWAVRPARLWTGMGWIDLGVIRSTVPLFVGMLGTALILNLDVLGLKLLSPLSTGDQLAGLYQAAVILARTPVFISQALTLVLFSYAAGQGKIPTIDQNATNYTRSALRSWFRLLLPGSLVMIVAPQAVLGLFFPSEYHHDQTPLQVAAAGALLLALATMLIGVYQAQGMRRRPAVVAGVAVFVQILTLVILVPSLGPLGSAISLLVAGTVCLAGIASILTREVRLRQILTIRPGWQLAVVRQSFPLVLLALPLLTLPDSTRWLALAKLSAAAFGYLAGLVAIHWGREPDDQNLSRQKRPVYHFVTDFVQVLIGG